MAEPIQAPTLQDASLETPIITPITPQNLPSTEVVPTNGLHTEISPAPSSEPNEATPSAEEVATGEYNKIETVTASVETPTSLVEMPTFNDRALMAAWEYLLDYDAVSTDEKVSYRAIRVWAIVMSLAATTASVLVSLPNEGMRLSMLLVGAVAIPIIASIIKNFDEIFTHKPRRQFKYVSVWILAIGILIGGIALVGAIDPQVSLWGLFALALLIPTLFFGVANYRKDIPQFIQTLGKRITSALTRRPSALEPSPPSNKKREFGFLPMWLVGMGVGLTLTALVAMMSSYDTPALTWVLQASLVIVPIISVGLLNYASEYARNTAWIEYRVAAERIRTEIYLYRTRASQYAVEDDVERQQLLLNKVEEAYKSIDSADFVPYMRARNEQIVRDEVQELCYQSPGTDDRDDGFAPLTVDEYLNYRVRPQIKWYVGRIRKDYIQKRRLTIGVLIFAGTGSALVGLDRNLASLVALSTAAGIALTMWSSVRTTGATYGLFHESARDLQMGLRRWEILSEEKRKDTKVVAEMENIFVRERGDWEKAVKQMQQSVEQAFKDSRSLTNRDDDDEKKAEEETKIAEGTAAK